MAIKNCLFDWSGTLVDDFLNVYKATALAFHRQGLKAISINRFLREFKLPYMDFWHKYLPDMTPAEEKVVFLSAWDALDPAQPFPFVHETLGLLRQHDFKIVLFSSHDQARLEREAAFFRLSDLFDGIKGSVLNKIEAIGGVLADNGFAPEETIFVGDMTHDIEASKAAGVISCALFWSEARYRYDSFSRIRQAEPDYIITDIRSLTDFLL